MAPPTSEWDAAQCILLTRGDGETAAGSDATSVTPQAAPLPPPRRRVGRFELIERVGAGGFGEVWRAFDPHLQREVALKLGHFDASDDGRPDLLLHEARAAGRLRHPAIVPVHEAGVEGDAAYVVSDYIAGTTLDRLLKTGPLPPCDAAELVVTLAEALAHAHAHGIIHRDVKPSNVLLDTAGGPHLTDFGVARRVAGDRTISEAGQPLGTPAYMSPEQARGDVVDPRSDVYSLGLVLYEMLAGRRAYPGSAAEALRDVLLGPPPPLRSVCRDLSHALVKIVEAATAREPADRYPTAAAFVEDLRRFLRSEPVQGPCVGAARRVGRLLRRRPIASVAVLALALPAMLPFGARVGFLRSGSDTGSSRIERRSGHEPRIAETKPVAPRVGEVKRPDDGKQLVEIRTEPPAERLWLIPRDALGYPMPDHRVDVPDPRKPLVRLNRGVEYLIVADCGGDRFAEVDRRVPTRQEVEGSIHEAIENLVWFDASDGTIRFELSISPPPPLDDFVLVPGGSFIVPDSPSWRVVVPPFYLAAEELTVAGYLRIETAWRERRGLSGDARLPDGVPPDLAADAAVPLRAADAMAIFAKAGLRPPDELEWHYAASLAGREIGAEGFSINGLRSGLAELTGSRMNPFPWQVDPAFRIQLDALSRNEGLFDPRALKEQAYVVRGGGPEVWEIGIAAGDKRDIHARHTVSATGFHLGLGGRPARSVKPRGDVEDFVRFAPTSDAVTAAATQDVGG